MQWFMLFKLTCWFSLNKQEHYGLKHHKLLSATLASIVIVYLFNVMNVAHSNETLRTTVQKQLQSSIRGWRCFVLYNTVTVMYYLTSCTLILVNIELREFTPSYNISTSPVNLQSLYPNHCLDNELFQLHTFRLIKKPSNVFYRWCLLLLSS